jgi:hypothetical protein
MLFFLNYAIIEDVAKKSSTNKRKYRDTVKLLLSFLAFLRFIITDEVIKHFESLHISYHEIFWWFESRILVLEHRRIDKSSKLFVSHIFLAILTEFGPFRCFKMANGNTLRS